MTSPDLASLQDNINRYYPYLLEIRKRLLFVAALFGIASIIGFFNYQKITTFILGFFNLKGVNVVFTSPYQFFSLSINTGMIVGLAVIFPLLLFQLLAFLKPALRPREFKLVLVSVPLSVILFACGFTFGLVVMKYVVVTFYQKAVELQIGNYLDIELLLSHILITSALMGLAFQFPIVMTFLMHLKIIKQKMLESQRLLFYLVTLIFVMLLPPTDLMSDALLFFPLVILFELTLILNRIVLKTHLL